MNCKTCKFFKKAVDLSNVASTQGACHRYPPKAFLVPANGNIGIMSARPAVEPNDYCGEYVVDTRKAGPSASDAAFTKA